MYYCPPPLESIIVYRITEDEMTVTVGEFESSTRSISFEYVDNRYSATNKLNLFGEICITNNSPERRSIRYRQAIPIPDGYVADKEPLGNVCIEDNEAVVIWETVLDPAEETNFDLAWSLPIFKRSEYDQNGVVNAEDLGVFLADWNTDAERSDFNSDGNVNGTDLGFLLNQWTRKY